MALIVREMELKDFTDIISLIKNELGHDGLSSDIYDRIMKIYENEAYTVFVADMDDKVIGFVGIMRGLAFELDGEYVRIIALAVKHEYQNHGVGTRLAERVEDYAYEIGASSIVLTSGRRRSDAHLFYGNMGYEKKGYSFIKTIHTNEHSDVRNDIFTPIPPRQKYIDEADLEDIGFASEE